ncbi:hypothetical protein WAJ43_24425, partial [Acinetobacter baumannii]
HEYTGIKASLIENGVEIIEPPLVERTAYSALFQFGGNLHSMKSKQGNMAAAIENAEAFAMAIFKKLTEALR